MPNSEPKFGWLGWGPREPDPTTLIALWPDGEAPTQTEVIAALAELGFASESDLEALPSSDETLWTAVARVKADAPPVVVWAEPAQPMSTVELREIGIETDNATPKWIVGFQSVLDPDDPLPSLTSMLRCANAGVRDAAAVLDVSARRWIPRAQLEVMLNEEAPLPPSELLWTIEVVSRGEGLRDKATEGQKDGMHVGGVWLRTQGLARCGRPELEMAEVPESRAAVAATLLNDVAEFLLEMNLPEPGEALEIGVGLEIALQPWSAVGPYLRAESAGSPADRAARGLIDSPGSPMKDGDMAFVCAAKPAGQFRQLWVWPREVVRALAEEGAAVYRTTRATERAAALAQHTWPELAMTWSRVRRADHDRNGDADADDSGGAVVLIKVGFEIETDEAPAREHLWFMVREIAGDQARGQLINEPMHATTMHEGDEVWVNREGVSDWRLIMPSAIVQPSDMLLNSPVVDRALAALESAG